MTVRQFDYLCLIVGVTAATLYLLTGCSAVRAVTETIEANQEGIQATVESIKAIAGKVEAIAATADASKEEILESVREWVGVVNQGAESASEWINGANVTFAELKANLASKLGWGELGGTAGAGGAALVVRNALSSKEKNREFAGLKAEIAAVKAKNGGSA